MQQVNPYLVPVLVGILGALSLAAAFAIVRFLLARAREEARQLLSDAQKEAEGQKTEILVAAQEKALLLEQERVIAAADQEQAAHAARHQAPKALQRVTVLRPLVIASVRLHAPQHSRVAAAACRIIRP